MAASTHCALSPLRSRRLTVSPRADRVRDDGRLLLSLLPPLSLVSVLMCMLDDGCRPLWWLSSACTSARLRRARPWQ